VIDDLLNMNSSVPDTAITYFYFDFSNPSTQSHDGLLRSLIWQMAVNSSASFQILQDCYKQGSKIGPAHWAHRLSLQDQGLGVDELLQIFKRMIRPLPCLYIVVDALDECVDRPGLLQLVESLSHGNFGKVNFFLVSRLEGDIEDVLGKMSTHQVNCDQELVDDDIRTYVHHKLFNLSNKWSECTRMQIEDKLCSRAKGM
jgi:hypothetical protein